MTLSMTSALYYPTIDIANDSWLRSAILFWDSIQTIVPLYHGRPYSSRLAQMLEDEGILSPTFVDPDMIEVKSLEEDILNYLTDPSTKHILNPDGSPETFGGIAHISPMKLPYFVRHEIEKISNDGFLQVDANFASFYMTLLAKKISEQRGLAIVTDSIVSERLSSVMRQGNANRSFDFYQRSNGRHYRRDIEQRSGLPQETAQGAIFDLMLRHLKLSENIPIKDLLKFRTDHNAELSKIRKAVINITDTFPSELSIDSMRQRVNDVYATEVVPAISELRSSLTATKWDFTFNAFLKTSFFSVPTSLTLPQLLHIPSPIALMAGMGVSATVSAATHVRQIQATRRSNDYSYLLSIETQFT